MAAPNTPPARLSGLAYRLVQDQVIKEDVAQKAVVESSKKKTTFVAYLVQEKLAAAKRVAQIASQEFGVPLLDLDALDLDHAPITLVEEKLVRNHHALPLFKRGNRLFLGVSDPTNLGALDEIKFHTGLVTEAVVVEEDKLVRVIDQAMRANETSIADMAGGGLENMDVDFGDEGGGGDEAKDEKGPEDEEAPVVRFVNKILLDAINIGASDIHIEPYEKNLRIRFRQDGILSEVAVLPNSIASRLTARMKVMSRMNLAEKRVPQDGRISLKLSKTRKIDFRVNTCPVLHGEKICLRILDPSSASLGIEALGFEAKQKADLEKAIWRPYGMVLVTGPTGSGKTVTLYTCVNIRNEVGVNISTAEDPAEIQLYGVNQVNVNPAVGLTFAEALKSFLRQDPDIVLVGEIRDLETGGIAIKAAQTGHLVLSTLHTNDAPQTLTRLMNMGIPAFNIASAVNLILAQRLARRLCKNCKAEAEIPRQALLDEGFREDEVDTLVVYKAVGCDQCKEGYKGRVGIFQVMPVSEEMGKIIMDGGTSIDLAIQAKKEGVWDLRESGLHKVRTGATSLEELNRVTME